MWIATAAVQRNGRAGAPVRRSPPALWCSRCRPRPLPGSQPTVVRMSADILASRKTADPVRVGLPDPTRSAAAVGAILATRAAVTGTSDARAALTWAVRSSPTGMPQPTARTARPARRRPEHRGPGQRTGCHRPQHRRRREGRRGVPGRRRRSAGLPGGGHSRPTRETAAAVDDLVRLLTGTQGGRPCSPPDSGRRTARPARPPPRSSGSTPTYRSTAPLPDAATIDDAIRSVQVTNEPSRMLAVIDISGSMQGVVPGANGATRIDLAKEAATRGLALYAAGQRHRPLGLLSHPHHEQRPPGADPDQHAGPGSARAAPARNGWPGARRPAGRCRTAARVCTTPCWTRSAPCAPAMTRPGSMRCSFSPTG